MTVAAASYSSVPWTDWPVPLIVATAAALGLAWAVGETLRGNHRTVTAAVLLAVTVTSGWLAARELTLESRLADAVRSTSGDPELNVNCKGWLATAFTDDGTEGKVQYAGNEHRSMDLMWNICNDLRNFVNDPAAPPVTAIDPSALGTVIGVHVLSHETQHLLGVHDEAEAECRAMAADAALAEALGATPDDAGRIADAYRTHVYPRMPSAYQRADCTGT